MPRRSRAIEGGLVYHILNRANGGRALFRKEYDYRAFEAVCELAFARVPLRILAFVVMPTHWHFVVWPKQGQHDEVSEFFRWLTVTHTQRWHAHHGTAGTGHLYQGRFKSFPVEADENLFTVARYVERNPVRAGLTNRAEEWTWSSAAVGETERPIVRTWLAEWPISRPRNWRQRVNRPLTDAELAAVRRSVQRGQPLGGSTWRDRITKRLGLESTFRPRGRPRKLQTKGTGVLCRNPCFV